MPFTSKAQQRKCYALRAKGQAGSWDCDEFAEATDFEQLPEKTALGLGRLAASKAAQDRQPTIFDRLWPRSFAKQPPAGKSSLLVSPALPGKVLPPQPEALATPSHDRLLAENMSQFYQNLQNRRLAAGQPPYPANREAAQRMQLMLNEGSLPAPRGMTAFGRIVPSTVSHNVNPWERSGEPQGTQFQTVGRQGVVKHQTGQLPQPLEKQNCQSLGRLAAKLSRQQAAG